MKIIGHRGARGLAPENTIASIKQALLCNVDQIEVDVQVTKDGVCVLCHDDCLKDVTDQKLPQATIADHTLLELRKWRPDLATLAEAIETINRKVSMYIEVKPGVSTAEIAQLLNHYLHSGWQPTDFFIASFSQKVLVTLHQALPELATIVNGHVSGVRSAWRARQLGTKYISLSHKVLWWGFIRSMSKKGYKLAAYTVNNPAKAKRWAKYGLYAVVTDYPDRFKSHAK
jgi:glycerophosphoryl diester phosphodiesterase